MTPAYCLHIGPLSDGQQQAIAATDDSAVVPRRSRYWREALDEIVVVAALEIDEGRMLRIDAGDRGQLDQIAQACRHGRVPHRLVGHDAQVLVAWSPPAPPSAKRRNLPIDEALAARRS